MFDHVTIRAGYYVVVSAARATSRGCGRRLRRGAYVLDPDGHHVEPVNHNR